jgi:heterodisulfide reductase subunit A
VNRTALVVGGGLAGMSCAISIANQGHEVVLLEKSAELGGMAKKISYTLEKMDVKKYLTHLTDQIYKNPRIRVYHQAEILEVTGYVGNFSTMIKSERGLGKINHGAVVLATGAVEYVPDEYLHGKNDRVFTQIEFEEMISKHEGKPNDINTVVMIQCVGCRQEDRNYCARICCGHAIKNSLMIKDGNPNIEVYILFRDMRTYGFREDYYREASNRNVKFIRYSPEEKPEVSAATIDGRNVLKVSINDKILGEDISIDADVLVLSAAIIPSETTNEVAGLFKVNLNPDGFFKEAHAKLKPVEFATEGVYLCGMAQYPKHISESVTQAYGAAGRVLTLLSRDKIGASGAVCEVSETNCVACGACIAACTYGAIKFQETPTGKKAVVNPVLCKGDGLCNTRCPTGAIELRHFTDTALLSQIDSALALS